MASNDRPSVVVVGGVNVDIIAVAPGPLQPGVSTPGRIRISAGGAGRNVAENLARLGMAVRLIAAVDAHPLSDLALEQTVRAGVDIGAVVRVRDRGNYYAAIEHTGAIAWAVSDVSAAEALRPEDLEQQAATLQAAQAVVVDSNLTPEAILQAVALSAGRLLCLLPVSPAKAQRVRAVLPSADVVVLGAREAAVLMDEMIPTPQDALRVAQMVRNQGPATVVITMGEQGMGWVGAGAQWLEAAPTPIVDPTGAGDAVAAVAVYARLAGLDEGHAARLARAAAGMTVGVEGATHPGLSLEALHTRA